MDPLTHAVSGAILAKAIPKQPVSRTTLTLLVLLAMAPDADYILRFVSDIFYLRHHRGATHSLLLLPLWAWLAYSLLPRRRKAEPLMPWLIASVLLAHIALDLLTSFGTMIFAPFSDVRLSWDLIFIIDPLFTATLLIPLLISLMWPQRARIVAFVALIAMSAYGALAYYNHQQALELTRRAHPQAVHVDALPLPFSPFYWQLIATYPDYYSRASANLWPGIVGLGSLFPASMAKPYTQPLRNRDALAWQRLPTLHVTPGIADMPGVDFYRWFARFPVLLHRDEQGMEFGDLRFGAGQVENSAFRLKIEMGDPPRAWMLWSKTRRSEIGHADSPSTRW